MSDSATNQKIRLPNNWQPRPYQLPAWSYLENGGKRACLVWHRRSGKDDIALNRAAVAAHERVGEYWHMLPEYSQGRKVIWEAVSPHTGVRRIDQAFPKELREKTRDDEMMIRFKNGSLWRVVGSDNYNSLVGATPVGVVFSEWALANPAAWAFLRPILAENGGWAVFIFTPRGANHGRKTYDLAQMDDKWFGEILRAEQTGVFSAEALQGELRDYIHDYGEEEGKGLFEQEYECSFSSPLFGSFYGTVLNKADREGRIGKVAIDRAVPVDTAWDLGYDDSSAIWFIQRVGREVRFVDYIEASGVGLDEYARRLEEKKKEHNWIYGEHFFPHDVAHHELSSGKSRVDTLRGLKIDPIVVELHNVNDGINAVRRMLDRAWFDAERCERGLNALRNYRREYDEDHKIFKPKPLHDWACVTGDTLVLTRCGMHPIKTLPPQGEVLTSCGWKRYENPRITRKNAPLVAVRFTDGLTVKCTAEHLFLTESGWMFAGDLPRGLAIQSSLTRLRSIGMAVSTAYGRTRDIILGAVAAFTWRCGLPCLAPFPVVATYTTGMTTPPTIESRIWNVCQWANTYRSLGIEASRAGASIHLRHMLVPRQRNGTSQKLAVCGTEGTPSVPRVGQNGSVSRDRAWSVVWSSIVLFAQAATSKSFVLPRARQLTIESVETLPARADVWCLTVKDGGQWSLANGAVTHNSHGADAARTFAAGADDPQAVDPKEIRKRYKENRPSAWAA